MAQKKPQNMPRSAGNERIHDYDQDDDRMDLDRDSLRLRPGDAGVRRKLFASAIGRATPQVRDRQRKSMPASLDEDDDWLPLASARRGLAMLPSKSAESLALDAAQRGVKRKRA